MLCMVDNCYGEFVETPGAHQCGGRHGGGQSHQEPGRRPGSPPAAMSAAESPASSAAPTGSVLRAWAVRWALTWAFLTIFYQGLFLAPTVVSSAQCGGAVFAAGCYEKLGFRVVPGSGESRRDIIQAVELGSREAMVAFCKGIQSAAPVDSYVTPEPWAMPGMSRRSSWPPGPSCRGRPSSCPPTGPSARPTRCISRGASPGSTPSWAFS